MFQVTWLKLSLIFCIVSFLLHITNSSANAAPNTQPPPASEIQSTNALSQTYIPTLLQPIPVRLIAVTVGKNQLCALSEEKDVYCWGGYYAIGHSGGNPLKIEGLGQTVKQIDTSAFTTCALLEDSTVKCWGYERILPVNPLVQVSFTEQPSPIEGWAGSIESIAVGNKHLCALLTTGEVQCWGENVYGQLGDGTTEERITPVTVQGLEGKVLAIKAGNDHTCAYLQMDEAATIKCWGEYRQVVVDGYLVDEGHLQPTDVQKLFTTKILDFDVNGQSCAVIVTGDVLCWGKRRDGMVAKKLNGLIGRRTGVVVGPSNVCVLTQGQEAQCWNGYQLNEEDQILYPQDPIHPRDLYNITQLATGGDTSCARLESGIIKCWGNDKFSGTIDKVPSQIGGLEDNVIAIDTQIVHACAITEDNQVKCWGSNTVGQLGDGTQEYRNTPVDVLGLDEGVSQISVGESHNCAVIQDGTVRCWGNNEYRQLGDGTMENRSIPVPVLGLTDTVESVALLDGSSCGLLISGGVQCWGSRWSILTVDEETLEPVIKPQFIPGLESGVKMLTASSRSPRYCVLMQDSTVRCWEGYFELGTIEDTVVITVTGFADTVVRISDDVAYLADGRVQLLPAGQLHETLLDPPLDFLTGATNNVKLDRYDGGCALLTNNFLQCWGNIAGQQGEMLGNLVDDFSVAMGWICALLKGNVYCWSTYSNSYPGSIDLLEAKNIPTQPTWLPATEPQ